MSVNYFDIFTRTIAHLPTKAIIRALDLECNMLEDDFEHERLASLEDANSILCFRQFLRTAEAAKMMLRAKCFPPDHLEFYKETIVRLVQARELPTSAMERFDYAFRVV
jgi:hypothetical protein